MKLCVYLFVFCLLIAILAIQDAEGRGGRGGGSRGSSRSSYRSRSSSSSSVRRYKGSSYTKGSWKTAAAAGVVFGLLAYKTRSMYYRYPNREPQICFNDENLRNGTYGYFVCPEQGQSDHLAYCCGSHGSQYCCTEKDKANEGRIAGIIIGVVVVCVIAGVIIYCIIKRRRQRAAMGGVIIDNNKPKELQPLTTNYSPDGGVPMQPYPPQPGMPMGGPGVPMGQVPPPQGYNPVDPGLPYSKPGDPGMYPAPGAYPPPGGPGAYPPPGGPGAYPPPGGDPNMYPPPPGGPNPYPPPGDPSTYPPSAGGFVPPPGAPPPGPGPLGFEGTDQKLPSAPPPAYPGGPNPY